MKLNKRKMLESDARFDISEIKDAFDYIIEKYNINRDDLYENGAIYYMNGNDGTAFDYSMNGRPCEFYIFWANEDGAAKCLIYEEKMEFYIYDKTNPFDSNLTKEEVIDHGFNLHDLVEYLQGTFDAQKIWDKAVTSWYLDKRTWVEGPEDEEEEDDWEDYPDMEAEEEEEDELDESFNQDDYETALDELNSLNLDSDQYEYYRSNLDDLYYQDNIAAKNGPVGYKSFKAILRDARKSAKTQFDESVEVNADNIEEIIKKEIYSLGGNARKFDYDKVVNSMEKNKFGVYTVYVSHGLTLAEKDALIEKLKAYPELDIRFNMFLQVALKDNETNENLNGPDPFGESKIKLNADPVVESVEKAVFGESNIVDNTNYEQLLEKYYGEEAVNIAKAAKLSAKSVYFYMESHSLLDPIVSLKEELEDDFNKEEFTKLYD